MSDVGTGPASSEIGIGPAGPDDVAACPAVEASAARLFPAEDLPPERASETTDVATLTRAQGEGRLLVARQADGRIVGFALVEEDDAEAHLEELDVAPELGRRGIGRALLEAACAWAAEHGHPSITLSTFRHLAWNAPFYSRAGFVEVPASDWTPALRDRAAEEVEQGLDPAKRVMMRRWLRP